MGLPKITFVMDYWDLPLRGLADWEGDAFYFALEQSIGFTGRECWSLRPLTAVQRAEMLVLQRQFETLVGLHCTYRDGKRLARYESPATAAQFYAWRAEHPDSFDVLALPIVAYTDFKEYVGDE